MVELDDRGFLVKCPQCGQRNRIGYERARELVRCGKCKTPIDRPGEPIEIRNEQLFDALIRSSALPVLTDFWAAWCGPCKMVAPELVKVAADLAGELIVAKVDTQALPSLAQRYRISSIPSLIVFANGREAARTAGAMPAASIKDFVAQGAAPV